MASQIQLYFLGSPHIERNGAQVYVDTRKAIALLAYLVLNPVQHSRDTLAALFWPEADHSHARAALRRTLSALNQALEGEGLSAERETIRLEATPDLSVDVKQFEDRVRSARSHAHPAGEACPQCQAWLAEAVEIYKGDFLSGFSLADSYLFDEWQFEQSERLKRALGSALETLTMDSSLQADYERAISYARRWLTLDALHEPAHRQLMQLYAWAGQRSAALRQYRECVRILEQELGVSPLEETTALYEAIKENQIPGRPKQASILLSDQTDQAEPDYSSTSSHHLLPLVGRTSEWDTLLTTYRHVQTQGYLVVIEGEAGIGKTRLAEAFLQHIASKGSVTIASRCYEGETDLAYEPFIQLLRGILEIAEQKNWLNTVPQAILSEISRLLPDAIPLASSQPVSVPLDSPNAQNRLFEAIKQLLSIFAEVCPRAALCIDNVQWADHVSLDLLTYLTRRLLAHPIYLLTTWRSEDVDRNNRLRQMFAEIELHKRGTLISIPRLNAQAVAELVQAIGIQADLSERLYQESEGLPFFLAEYVAWILDGKQAAVDQEWALPTSIQDLLRSRLSTVNETGWQILTTAAVIERAFDFDILRDASGRSEEELVQALEILLQRGLMREASVIGQPPIYDFSHEKLRTLVYLETSLVRRRLLHRRVAQVLAARAERKNLIDNLASQIAYHFKQAGMEAEAADYYVSAGDYARRVYANREALLYFQSAAALGYADQGFLYEVTADLYTLVGEYSAALKHYEAAAAHSEAALTLARIEHRIGKIYHWQGEWSHAESHYQAGLDEIKDTDVPTLKAGVLADWSLAKHHQGEAHAANRLAQQALDYADQSHDKLAQSQAHNVLGILARGDEKLELARHHLEQSFSLAQSLNEPSAQIAALNNLALVHAANNDHQQAILAAQNALKLCSQQGDVHREAALLNNLADLFHATHQPDIAMQYLKKAVTLFSQIGAEADAAKPEIWKLVEW